MPNSMQSEKSSRWPAAKWAARWMAAAVAVSLAGATLAGKNPCGDKDIARPEAPAMIETDLGLLLGVQGQPPLPEWSKIEKLRGFFRRMAESEAPCAILEGEDLAVRLFVARDSLEAAAGREGAGRFSPGKAFQFYGSSRLKVERSDQNVTRVYAFPLKGAATIADASGEKLEVLLEDLAQIQMVTVPRLSLDTSGGDEGCLLVSQVTAVPSRVFDEPRPREPFDPAQPKLTLDARRRGLEYVAREVRWLQRVEKEPPGCRASEREGYLGRQITSLNLTVGELVPDLDFVAESLRFWKEVERRIEKIRAEDEAWKKELGR